MPVALVTTAARLDGDYDYVDDNVQELLLPHAVVASKWDRLQPKTSGIHENGIFPKGTAWSNVTRRMLMPFLGLETVTQDEETQACLVKILQSVFEPLTVAELQAAHGGAWMRDGSGYCVPHKGRRALLEPTVLLLQVSNGGGGVH